MLGEEWLGLQLARVHCLNHVELVNLISRVRREQKIEHEVLESVLANLTIAIDLGFCCIVSLIDRIVDGLIGTAGFHRFLFMDVVANHEAVVLDLQVFEALLADTTFGNLATQDLSSNVVLARQNQLHLVQNERDLLPVFQRAVRLDLNLLNDLRSLIDLAIGLVHFNELASRLRVLAFQENFSISRLSQRTQHEEALFARGQLTHEGVHAERDHISGGFLSLRPALHEDQEPFAHMHVILLIKGCLQLHTILQN